MNQFSVLFSLEGLFSSPISFSHKKSISLWTRASGLACVASATSAFFKMHISCCYCLCGLKFSVSGKSSQPKVVLIFSIFKMVLNAWTNDIDDQGIAFYFFLTIP